jgi:predicted dehydrogenase
MISSTSKPLTVAIVGCGLIGNKRAQVLATDPESRLCAAADPDMACAEALWAEFCSPDDGKKEKGGQLPIYKIILDTHDSLH